jgi:hypothetical protein
MSNETSAVGPGGGEMNREQLSVVNEPFLQRLFVLAAFVVLLLSFSLCMAQDQQAPVPERDTQGAGQSVLIPEADIVSIEQALQAGARQGVASTASRRTFKNAARKGLALIKEAPSAANRFRVLSVIFQCQKRLLEVENIEQNRTALFETCEQLTRAPDEYAEIRLEADLLLSERDLSGKNATLEERAGALAELIERYRGTTAEARSLLMGCLIVQKLDAPELEDAILYALDENFSDDAEVIEFRLKYLKISRLDVTFKGTFERSDGTTLSFPSDTAGRMCMMVFWSKHNPGYEKYLERTKEELAKFSGRVHVFSFNLDELTDGGESILKAQGLDWAALLLPEGKGSQVYRTYAQGDPVSILVNEYGLSVIRPEIGQWRMNQLDPATVSEDRYSAQLQSLFIGDFLLPGQPPANPHPASTLQAIQDGFVIPPFRYRLTEEEALSSYTKTAQLCAEATQKDPNAPDISDIRNRRIIALLGMRSLACQPKYLEEAVAEAKVALASNPPAGADVVPRFCLAKEALRKEDVEAESVVTRFLEDCGGSDAPAAAMAAAAILALEVRSRELHKKYRGLFLEKHADNPAFYAFTSFLRDRHHQYRLLKANYSRSERHPRSHIVAFGQAVSTNRLPDIELMNLDGSAFILPKETHGKLTYLLFVEPPADPKADFPMVMDSRGNATRNDYIRGVMRHAGDLTSSHVNNDISFVAAFLTDNADQVRFLMETNKWTCQAVMVPGGLANPMVRQLGILSADRIPNVFVLRRDGSIAWRASGLSYQTEFGFPYAFLLAMNVHVEACEVETAHEALEKGDFQAAVRIFSGPFPPGNDDRYGWLSPRYHGKALAHMGLKEWEAALDSIDKAIDAHKLLHFRGRRSKAADWQKDAATVVMKEVCDTLPILWAEKILMLDQLGRKQEAEELRQQCAQPARVHKPNLYSAYHERLKALSEIKK